MSGHGFVIWEKFSKAIDVHIKQLQGCPERIDIEEIDRDVDTEGKNLWDLAQALAWNGRRLLSDMFGNYLSSPRDLLPVSDAITYCLDGYVAA